MNFIKGILLILPFLAQTAFSSGSDHELIDPTQFTDIQELSSHSPIPSSSFSSEPIRQTALAPTLLLFHPSITAPSAKRARTRQNAMAFSQEFPVAKTLTEFYSQIARLPEAAQDGEELMCPYLHCRQKISGGHGCLNRHLQSSVHKDNALNITCMFCKKKLCTREHALAHLCACTEESCSIRTQTIAKSISHALERHPVIAKGFNIDSASSTDSFAQYLQANPTQQPYIVSVSSPVPFGDSAPFEEHASVPKVTESLANYLAAIADLPSAKKAKCPYCPIQPGGFPIQFNTHIHTTHRKEASVKAAPCVFCKRAMYVKELCYSHACVCPEPGCGETYHAHRKTEAISFIADHILRQHPDLAIRFNLNAASARVASSTSSSSSSSSNSAPSSSCEDPYASLPKQTTLIGEAPLNIFEQSDTNFLYESELEPLIWALQPGPAEEN